MTVDDRPDIVIVLTDQQRADVSAREGWPLDTTPFLDSLGRDGVWFDRAYTTSPLCCPARTSLLTGRWPSAHGVRENPGMDLAEFRTDLLQAAGAAGYATALIGKNHTYASDGDVDHLVEFLHAGRVGVAESDDARTFDAWLKEARFGTVMEPTPFPVELQNPSRIVDEALRWTGTLERDRPMLMIVSFPEPHNPYQVPEPYYSLFPPEHLPPVAAGAEALEGRSHSWRYLRALQEEAVPELDGTIERARANYFGMLRLIDDQLRRLHDGLETRHAARERVLLATADHGDFVGEYGLLRKGAEIPDVLARIPLLLAGDAIPPADGPSRAHVSIADLMPTLCEAMGVPVPPGVQGRSLWPLVTGDDWPQDEFASVLVEQGMGGLPYDEDDVPEDMPGLFRDGPHGEPRFDELNAVTQSGVRRKIRCGDWTLYADVTGEFRLYDLVSDPVELDDRWDDPDAAEARDLLLRHLAVWQMRTEDPLPVVPRGYVRKSDVRGYVTGR